MKIYYNIICIYVINSTFLLFNIIQIFNTKIMSYDKTITNNIYKHNINKNLKINANITNEDKIKFINNLVDFNKIKNLIYKKSINNYSKSETNEIFRFSQLIDNNKELMKENILYSSNKTYDTNEFLNKLILKYKNINKNSFLYSENGNNNDLNLNQYLDELNNLLINLIPNEININYINNTYNELKNINNKIKLFNEKETYSKELFGSKNKDLDSFEYKFKETNNNAFKKAHLSINSDNLISIAELTPTTKYSDGTDIPCINSNDCFVKKLKWMKCTIDRVSLRTAYETANIPLRVIGFVVYNLCACVNIPSGNTYQIDCFNTIAQPGSACTLPNMVYKSIFKNSFMIWESYVETSSICKNPIGPYGS